MWIEMAFFLKGLSDMNVKIHTDYIELQQLLKLTDWISTGGEAKIAVKKLNIYVNGIKVVIQGKEYEVTK